MKTLALCIPAYNAAVYLPRLLESAKRQTVPFDEILVYNDCSVDNTAAIAEKHGAKVINGTTNKGCSHGKNVLADTTSCSWIHFHDADDELLPEFTTLAHKWISQSNCPDVVLFSYEYRHNNSKELIGIKYFDKEKLESDPLSYAIVEQINPFCGLYNRDKFVFAGGYDTDPLVLYNEDCAFHIALAKAGLKFSAEKELSIVNYKIENSMSGSNYNKCLEARFFVLNKTALTVNQKYYKNIVTELWKLCGPLSAVSNWIFVKKCLALIKKLGHSPYPIKQVISWLAYLNPFFAVWFREMMIRIFKPHLR